MTKLAVSKFPSGPAPAPGETRPRWSHTRSRKRDNESIGMPRRIIGALPPVVTGLQDEVNQMESRVNRLFSFLALAVLGAAVLIPSTAEASHYRYGHTSWRPAGGTTIDFNIQNAFRRDGNPCVSTLTNTTIPCTGPGGFPGVGDVIVEVTGGTQFFPGDSSVIGSPLGPLYYVVTAIDPANNWLLGNALDPTSLPLIDTAVTHTYTTMGDYLAFIDSCCRISAGVSPNDHMNNPDGGYR